MITCERSRDAIVMAAFGELDAAALDDLRRHLAVCAACAEQARDIEGARHLVASAEGNELPPSFSPPRGGARWMKLVRVAAAAAVLVGILGAAASFTLLRSDDSGAREPQLRMASGAVGDGAEIRDVAAASGDAYLGDDGFGTEIESLQSELASLESKVGEF